MTYTPYLIANYATGLDTDQQPWLLPDDAQQELYDGYVYRGVMNKRPGYNYFATGERNGQPYCESRIVNRINAEQSRTSGGALVTGTGTVGPYVFKIQNTPLRRGTTTITAGAQSATDNGLGGFVGLTNSTIDYTTGDVSITFNAIVSNGTQLTETYDYHPGDPVMGIMNFITSSNVKQLIVADTKRLNVYDSTNNVLNYLGATYSITALTKANPGVVTTSAAHNLSTGDRIFIYGAVGMNQVNNLSYTIIVTGTTTFSIGVDTTTFGTYTSGGTVQLQYNGQNNNFWSWVNYPDKDGNPRLIFTNNVDQVQYYQPLLTPSVGDYVHYPTAASPDFHMIADDGTTPIATFTALQTFINKDRLVFLRTTENGVIKPRRERISGTGIQCDDFRTSATGAGFIDISDQTWFFGGAFNRDDLVLFTESSTHIEKYTGNDTTPFTVSKIDESRGSGAPFSAITYLNRTTAASPRGLIITDGYRVERADDLLPEFSFNNIDGENFDLCFAGSVDEDRDHYLIYPPPNSPNSERILTTNYDEDNYAIYRLPLSCMGTYVSAFDISWNDLLSFPDWDSFAAVYGNWNSFAYTAGAPFSLGGGHRGEIWALNVTEVEDNPVKVRNITIIDGTTIEVTTDWNNYSLNINDATKGADVIWLTDVQGMLQVNGKQYPVIEVVDNNTFRLQVPSTADFGSYVSAGEVSRVIPFSALFKKFNPFVSSNKKVRCGWIYFYVDTSGTSLTRNITISNATQSNPCIITTSVNHNLINGQQIQVYDIAGMTDLNNGSYFVTVIDPQNISLNGVDSTNFGAYVSGGFVSVQDKCRLQIDIITDDVEEPIQVQNINPNPLQANCTNMVLEDGAKKWYKAYINQVGKFIQFRVRNQQAGAKIAIQATMPGFMPVGRLI